MNTRNRIRLTLSALMLGSALAGVVRSEDVVPADRRLPKDVAAYVSIPNVKDVRTQWGLSQYGQLSQEAALADFWAEVGQQTDEISKQIEAELGVDLNDLLALPQGEFAAAAFVPQGGKLAVVVFFDFGDKEAVIQKLLDKAAEGLDRQGTKRTEEDFEETRLVLYQNAPEDPNQPARDVGGYFLKDSLLVVGSHPLALKSVLSRWDGRHDNTLAENEHYRYVAERCRDENQESKPLLSWYLDPIGLVKGALAASGQANFQTTMVLGMLPTLGLDRLRGVGGSFDMARGDFDMVSRTFVLMEQPSRGVLNLVQFDVGGQAPPSWVGADTASYFTLSWNIGKAYAAAEILVDSFQGKGAFSRLVESAANNEATGRIHPKKDLIDHLTGTFHLIGDVTGPAEAPVERMLVAVELKNAAAAKATLTKIASIPGLPVKEREFKGEPLYEISPPGAGQDDDDGQGADAPTAMGLAIAENQLMFATDVKVLEQILRGSGDREALSESAAYKRISRWFPAQTSSISFSRQDAQIKAVYNMVRTGRAGQALGTEGTIDFSKLPEFDVIKKYLSPSGSYMQTDDRGLKITSFSLRNTGE